MTHNSKHITVLTMPRRRKKRKNYFRYILLIALTIGVYFGYSEYMRSKAFADIPSHLTLQGNASEWWNENYAYRRSILISGEKSAKYFTLNHAELVIESKSNEDGSDLIIVGQGNNKFTEVPFEMRDQDEINVEIGFDTSSVVAENYYLYYGNKMPEKNNVLGTFSLLDNASEISIGLEESGLVTITPAHSWVLKEASGTLLNLTLAHGLGLGNYFEASYVLDNGDPVRTKSSGTNLNIDLTNTPVGKHSLFLIIRDDNKNYRTNTVNFIISAPVYVAWTLDWEGIEPGAENLAELQKIANEYKIPLVHYFNPRVLIHTAISKQRKQDIVAWLKDRLYNFGDEFSMHMHMHHDMVEFAGVKPREDAKSWDNGTAGYDTPTSDYPYSEFLKLVTWGKSVFTQYGLPAPVGYRAGGWFADSDTLKVLEDTGFKYDSSGRKSFVLGSGGIQQAWTLDITTQPYHPAYNDQNNQNPTDPMKLLEIPNNGMDSYWSQTQQLIDNFYANYIPGTFLNEDVVVVYLTHPEWFNSVDKPKVIQLFAELDKYSYEKNKGPVKFITLEKYMKESIRSNR